MFPILETERLLLREIVTEDAPTIYQALSNPEVVRFYGQEALTNIIEAQQIIGLFATQFAEKRGIRWGIQRKGEKSLIGTVGFHAWSPKHKRVEIGYELDQPYWGKGYAKEAITAAINYAFQEMDITRIGAVVFTENKASYELLLKLGFQQEGVLQNYLYQYGIPNNANLYSLLKPV